VKSKWSAAMVVVVVVPFPLSSLKSPRHELLSSFATIIARRRERLWDVLTAHPGEVWHLTDGELRVQQKPMQRAEALFRRVLTVELPTLSATQAGSLVSVKEKSGGSDGRSKKAI